MLKLARWSTTHRVYVLVGWVALLLVVGACTSRRSPGERAWRMLPV